MKHSPIEWTDHTFNPWEGCTKVSPGCANCYAETLMDTRYGRVKWGPGQPRSRTSAGNWKLPMRWERAAKEATRRQRVFCASLADWLDDEVPIEWLADLLDLIRSTPSLDWQLLTKRPENWRPRLEKAMRYTMMDSPITDDKEREKDRNRRHALACWLQDWVVFKNPPGNVWVGTTVEDQARAEERIPALLSIPARVRFLSCEPLLGPVDFGFSGICHRSWGLGFSPVGSQIHWVICGGESGPCARPMHPDWARSLRNQCAAAGVPFFFKQMGGTRKPFPEIPAELNVRQFPEVPSV